MTLAKRNCQVSSSRSTDWKKCKMAIKKTDPADEIIMGPSDESDSELEEQ